MNRPIESDYTSQVAYTRALEEYCDALETAQEPVATNSKRNTFNPDWDTEAVLVEEMQRLAKRIEELEELLTRQTAHIVDLQTHIENLEGHT